MLTKIVVIISQQIHKSSYYIIPLKLTQHYMLIISQLKKNLFSFSVGLKLEIPARTEWIYDCMCSRVYPLAVRAQKQYHTSSNEQVRIKILISKFRKQSLEKRLLPGLKWEKYKMSLEDLVATGEDLKMLLVAKYEKIWASS